MLHRPLETTMLVVILLFVSPIALSAQSQEHLDRTPETAKEIARYRNHLIQKQHQKISDYPQKTRKVSSLNELAEYAGKSGVHVRMKPGSYTIDINNYSNYLKSNGENTLLNFSGTNSFFDLRGVQIKIDTRIAPASNRPLGEVSVSGKNLIVRGLTITNIMSSSPIGGNHTVTCRVNGSNNLVRGMTIEARGTHPYGYGDYLAMYKGWHLPRVPKRTALSAGGQQNVFVDIRVFNRGNGHAVQWPGSGDQTFINCHIEGEVRLTDDIFDELTEPGYGPRFEADFDLQKRIKSLPEHLGPGRLTSLGEDAFRAYGGGGHGTVKVLGCTVKNVRNVFIRGDYESSFISNTTVLRKWGFHTNHAPDTTIVNCESDLLYGMFLVVYGGKGRNIDLTVVPSDPDFLPVDIGTKGRSALIDGRGHKVILNAERELRIENPPPIKVKGQHIKLRNETSIPIQLTNSSKSCKILTNGGVTDNGTKNRVRKME